MNIEIFLPLHLVHKPRSQTPAGALSSVGHELYKSTMTVIFSSLGYQPDSVRPHSDWVQNTSVDLHSTCPALPCPYYLHPTQGDEQESCQPPNLPGLRWSRTVWTGNPRETGIDIHMTVWTYECIHAAQLTAAEHWMKTWPMLSLCLQQTPPWCCLDLHNSKHRSDAAPARTPFPLAPGEAHLALWKKRALSALNPASVAQDDSYYCCRCFCTHM